MARNDRDLEAFIEHARRRGGPMASILGLTEEEYVFNGEYFEEAPQYVRQAVRKTTSEAEAAEVAKIADWIAARGRR